MRSNQPEFVVVYGRRRVGKTYLIKEFFNQRFSFYATGMANVKTARQLKGFQESLKEYGCSEKKVPADWFEAFARLKQLLLKPDVFKDPVSGKKVVFLDELPWMDTARSDFRSALEYFWNSWASAQRDVLLIVCGSASSWILKHLIADRGGFYNRITRRIHLLPFTLSESKAFLESRGLVMSAREIIESQMVFGGIPYYLNLLDSRLSLAGNIDTLCFQENGQLYYEYRNLFQSLFKHAEKHILLIQAMARRKSGILRTELTKIPGISDGEPLSTALLELEQCGFIRKYRNYSRKKSGYFYQITDPFTLFSLTYLDERKVSSWMAFQNSPGYFSWCGNAFEMVCLNHIPQIKRALGISGVESAEYSWRSRGETPGAQIDLLIDRKDGVINLCEMKYTLQPFVIEKEYEKQLIHKINCFRQETATPKAIHLTMITNQEMAHNAYAGLVQSEISYEDLFEA